MLSDHELIKGCLEKNPKAQETLYKRFAPRMYGVCLRYAKNKMEADDILQEGFIKVFRNLEYFRHEGSLEGWIRKTMVNTAINYYKKNLKYTKEDDISSLEVAEHSPSNVFDKMTVKELLKLVRLLPEGYRVVFNLNVIEGFTHKEIGKLLNISENTSKSQLSRARNYLKKLLNNQTDEGDE